MVGVVHLQRPREERLHLYHAFVVSGFIAFVSAPVWYFLRGRYTEFFSGWWTYARFLSISTGRSFGSQLALGWDRFYAYYEQRPFAAAAILAFLVLVYVEWATADRRTRLVHGALIGWFAGSWIELVLSQRYSSQYFVVSSVPTALMIAALAGRLYRALVAARGRVRGTYAWPLLALVMAIYWSGPQPFVSAMHDLSAFTSVHQHAVQVDESQAGDIRSVRAPCSTS